VVAAETLRFLENNQSYEPIVMHGFSVGAYQLGEIMLQMSRDMDRYGSILDRFVCQIWDSAADITEIPVGVPKSIFPRNERMQSALRNYTLYHMKTFHNQATIHYMRSSQMFHSTAQGPGAVLRLRQRSHRTAVLQPGGARELGTGGHQGHVQVLGAIPACCPLHEAPRRVSADALPASGDLRRSGGHRRAQARQVVGASFAEPLTNSVIYIYSRINAIMILP